MMRMIEDKDVNEESTYVLIARTTFRKEETGEPEELKKVIHLPGKISKVFMTCNLYIDPKEISKFVPNPNYINGVKGSIFYHLEDSGLKHFAKVTGDSEHDVLEFFKMPPSLCILLATNYKNKHYSAISQLKNLTSPNCLNLSIGAINHLLYRSNIEEEDCTKKERSVYEFKNLIPKYAGIAGLMHEFMKGENSSPIFDNIKEGDWLIDYVIARIDEYKELKDISEWLHKYLSIIKDIYPDLKSKWFVTVISRLYYSVYKAMIKQSNSFFSEDQFSARLLLSTVQFLGNIPSSSYRDYPVALAAGLPFFTVGYMRCWGRDTMISLRGLALIPKSFKTARDILLMFASVMRHGLIPNLHDQGKNSRFNSRDATWFFMEALKEYVNLDTEKGTTIFSENVQMAFLDNNQEEHFRKLKRGERKSMRFDEIIQEMMQAHAKGIDFVEWNAGPNIDQNMAQPGFHVQIRFDANTGFIFGGNQHNCGTWMDKLGSSDKAKNRGVPATPRDGADVEIIGLLRSTTSFLEDAFVKGYFKYDGVDIPSKGKVTYKQWVFR